MNTPNKLTIIRILLVPVLLVVLAARFPIPSWVTQVIAASVFLAASLTDLFDGKIARKRGLITDFGKFMDPLADKFLVFAALLGILFRYDGSEAGFADLRPVFVWAAAIVIFRELAVTSLRLIAVNAEGVVIAANIFGKMKTTMQIVFVLTALLEEFLRMLDVIDLLHIPSYVTLAVMTFMTVFSGITYVKAYWKYIGATK